VVKVNLEKAVSLPTRSREPVIWVRVRSLHSQLPNITFVVPESAVQHSSKQLQ